MPIEANSAGIAEQARLIRALQNPAAFGPNIGRVGLIETHISYNARSRRQNVYPAATEQTYRHVTGLARCAAQSGFVTIVDGAFLRRSQRDLLRRLAADLGIPFVIVTFDADAATLRHRVARRAHDTRDASEADVLVLDDQRLTQQALGSDEQTFAVSYDARAPLARGRSALSCKAVIERLATSKPWIPRCTDSGQGRFVA